MKTNIRLTEDGSHTLFVPELNETYHSSHGAIQEAEHVFLKMGFDACKKDPIYILEVGFGTGLNAFLTLLHAIKEQRKVIYHSIELYPVSLETIHQLNYVDQINADQREVFQKIHEVSWNESHVIDTDFTLMKIKGNLLDVDLPTSYDVIYFDAFAPNKQEEMWSDEIFQKMYNHTNLNGILTTYCAKGTVKRTIKRVGYELESLPGPPGKREMSRGRVLA